MSKLLIVGSLFVLAGLCEIGGGYLVWGWMRESRPLAWALFGGGVLALNDVLAARATAGRVRVWHRCSEYTYTRGAKI